MPKSRIFRRFALYLSIAQIALFPAMGMAQTPNACGQAAPSDSSKVRSTRESSGIRIAINSLNIRDRYLTIQMAVQNITKSRQYVLIYGSRKAASDTGVFGQFQELSGINSCDFRADDSDALHTCRDGKAKNIDDFTYIEPCEFTTATIQYFFNDNSFSSSARTVSFAIDLLARAARADVDSLSDAHQRGRITVRSNVMC